MQSGSSVLIVDDEAIIAESIELTLSEANYQVIGTAAGSEEALALAEENPPAFAIVDVRLATPINGVTLAEELKRLYGTRILFVTAFPGSLVEQGVCSPRNILVKPFSDGELLQVIAEL